MAEGDPSADQLSATRQITLVLRLAVEVMGRLTGEIVDPISNRRQRFAGMTELTDAIRTHVDNAASDLAGSAEHCDRRDS